MPTKTGKKQRCSAKAKSTGKQCQKWAVTGWNVCGSHGAGSPWQGRPGGRPIQPGGGRYSKDLPLRLASRYEEFRNDPEILSLHDDVALIDARIGELVHRADTNEAGFWWDKLRGAYDDLVVAMRRGNDPAVAAGLNDLNRFIDAGGSDYATWAEISKLIDQRNRLVSSERKRLIEMQQMISVQQANKLVMALLSAVNTYVTEPKSRNAVLAEFIRLTEIEDNQRLEVGDDGAGSPG